jgi:hypothetical protein
MSSTYAPDRFTDTQLAQPSMLEKLGQQRTLLIGGGLTLAALVFLMRRRQPAQERAARRLVRDWRRVDDLDDARDLLGSNVPAVLRPAMLVILAEVERQVQHALHRVERAIHKL